MEHDEVMSLTVSMEGTLLTTVIEAQEVKMLQHATSQTHLSKPMWRRRTNMEIEPS